MAPGRFCPGGCWWRRPRAQPVVLLRLARARAAGKLEAADKQARRHGEEAEAAGAAAVVTACVSCAFQLSTAQRAVPVFHYLELLYDWRVDWRMPTST